MQEPSAAVSDAFRNKMVQFARADVAPSLHVRAAQQSLDPALLVKFAQTGLFSSCVPAAAGGQPVAARELLNVLASFGEEGGDMGLGLAGNVHGIIAASLIATHGSATQKSLLLPSLMKAESIFGMSLHELEGGAQTAATTVVATRSESTWKLNGVKPCTVNALIASHLLVLCKTGQATHDMTLFCLDAHAPGVRMQPRMTFPLATCPVGDVTFDQVLVTESAAIGSMHMALGESVRQITALERTLLLGPWLGLMNYLLQKAVARCHELAVADRTFAKQQGFRRCIAEMRRHVEKSWAVLDRAIDKFESGKLPTVRESVGARLIVADALEAIARTAVGFFGVTHDATVDRALEESRVLSELGGGPILLQSVLATCMSGIFPERAP